MLRQCESTLLKVCLYFSSRQSDDISDLYQTIACVLWETWPTFRGESNINTWVTRVALNVANNEKRRRKHRPQFVEFDERICENIAAEIDEDRYQRLYDLINRLDDNNERNLLFLYLDGKRLQEIAEITGTTEASVKNKMKRIKKRLIDLERGTK